MPNYINPPTQTPIAISVGEQVVAFNAEQPAVPQASIEFALPPNPRTLGAALSVEVSFSGAPGVFEVDLQEADTDADANFVSNATTITAVNAGNVGRQDYANITGQFVRILLKTRTNAVNALIKITRKA
jgi:hypothetical protein